MLEPDTPFPEETFSVYIEVININCGDWTVVNYPDVPGHTQTESGDVVYPFDSVNPRTTDGCLL